jgi:hypothetical protein
VSSTDSDMFVGELSTVCDLSNSLTQKCKCGSQQWHLCRDVCLV